jgi:hypothetical protein
LRHTQGLIKAYAKNCGGDKTVQRAAPEHGFSEPEPPEWAAKQLPFVMRWKIVRPIFKHSFLLFCEYMPAHIALVGGLTLPKNSNALNIFTYIFLQ